MEMKKIFLKVKDKSTRNYKKRILKNYYSKEMRGGKNFRAATLDRILLIFITFISLTTMLTIKSNNFLLSLYISLISTFFVAYVMILLFNKKKVAKIEMINSDLKRRRIIKEISGLNNEGFINYIKDILEEHYKTEIFESQSPFDLNCIINKEKYGIRCIKLPMDQGVSLKDISILLKEKRKLNLDEIIVVTNSYFRDEVLDRENIIPIDLEEIEKILISINKYPTNLDMENYIIDRYTNRQNSFKKQIKILNNTKIIQLYSIFLIFYILSYFVPYTRYYKIVAIIAFMIGTILGGYKISEQVRIKKELHLNK